MRDECYTCIREIQHGGQCQGKDGSVPCLAYVQDPRGRREWLRSTEIDVPLGRDIPRLYEPYTGWEIDGVDKTITITYIYGVEWSKSKGGLLGVEMIVDLWYWSHENGELPPDKPKLRLVKNGGKENARD